MWLPIMIPLDSWWKAPYFWAGTKAYDILAGSENIESSYFLTRSKALDVFPMLKKEGLKGALVYYGTPSDPLYLSPSTFTLQTGDKTF
jgi:glycerol-3-phosphate dehydrogenase